MHGYSHIYDKETNKKDFFKYGGKSEFFGHSLENQLEKIKKGLEIFKNRNIKVRSFFSPNHTYDHNTFKALKMFGIKEIIDGYGFKPYLENDIKFIFTANSISSIDIKITITFFLFKNMPITPRKKMIAPKDK